MKNTGFNVFKYINSKTKQVENLKMSYNQSWSAIKTGDKKMDSIFAKADLNGDGIAQANEIDALSRLMSFADTQVQGSANDGVIDKKELSFLDKLFKNNKIDMNNIPQTEQRVQTNGKPWSEGLNRNISTISISARASETIANFDLIKRELTEIGKLEGFSITEDSYGKKAWAEDAKINRADGRTYVQYYNDFDLRQNDDAVDKLAKSRKGFNVRQGAVAKSGSNFAVEVENSNRHIGTSYLEGGNVLQTLTADGSAGAIVGDMSVAYTLSVMNLDNTPENVEKAKQAIANDLGIKQENLTVIPQYDFHIDMCYRPLGDGEVAIPDYDEGIKILQNLLADDSISKSDKAMYSQMLEKLEQKKTDAQAMEIRAGAEQKLTEGGYKIVKIPDFGDYNINYMNAVAGTSNKDGKTFLITNKSNFPRLDSAVQEYYQNAGVDRVYFVSTKGALDKGGGIDCLTNASM